MSYKYQNANTKIPGAGGEGVAVAWEVPLEGETRGEFLFDTVDATLAGAREFLRIPFCLQANNVCALLLVCVCVCVWYVFVCLCVCVR